MRTDNNTVGYKIYVKGNNNYSQCTTGGSIQDKWKRVDQKFTNNAPIRSICCGYYHTLVLTENNELFGCGSNSECQLATNRSVTILPEFTLLDKGDAQNAILQQVECGGYFSLFLSQSGELYGCGQYNFLGLGNGTAPTDRITKHKQEVFDSPIVKVECGGGTSACLTRLGSLFVVGSVASTTNSSTFQKFPIPNHERVKQVSMGYGDYITLLTGNLFVNINNIESGKLYTGGFSEGNGKLIEITPTRFREPIIGFSCGYNLSVLMSNATVFSIDNTKLSTPREYTVESGIRLLSCHTSDSILVLANDNRLYLQENRSLFVPEEDPPLESGEVVSSIQTGYNYRIVVTGFLKKKPLRLHPNWKLDDINIVCLH